MRIALEFTRELPVDSILDGWTIAEVEQLLAVDDGVKHDAARGALTIAALVGSDELDVDMTFDRGDLVAYLQARAEAACRA